MIIRKAQETDIPQIIELLADDVLGETREKADQQGLETYLTAFARIQDDKNQELIVLVEGKQVIGTLQLSFIQYLTYQGGLRAQIEAVRIHKTKRGLGIGEQMIQYAIKTARDRGAHLVQLTTDKKRSEAIQFYEKLGFTPSHEGMKLLLN